MAIYLGVMKKAVKWTLTAMTASTTSTRLKNAVIDIDQLIIIIMYVYFLKQSFYKWENERKKTKKSINWIPVLCPGGNTNFWTYFMPPILQSSAFLIFDRYCPHRSDNDIMILDRCRSEVIRGVLLASAISSPLISLM